MRFKNKTVIVTGSSRGIGKATALAFAADGANLVINYINNVAMAKEVVSEIKNMGGNAICIKADVTNFTEIQMLVNKTIENYGAIDILVNNAGCYQDRVVHKMSEEYWDKVIDVNLKGTFHCTKAVIEYMKNQAWGRIVNISSVVGQIGVFGTANYAAAKAGIFGFTKAVAKEVATKYITVNALALGYFDTGMLHGLPTEIQEQIRSEIPMKRLGTLEEITEAVLFLCSEPAAYITGQVIHINGGYYM